MIEIRRYMRSDGIPMISIEGYGDYPMFNDRGGRFFSTGPKGGKPYYSYQDGIRDD